MSNFLYSILVVVFCISLLGRLGFLIGLNHNILVAKVDLDAISSAYQHSQYNLGQAEFFGDIDDDLLYTYAAHQLTQSLAPDQINPEVPPLIKYLYGLGLKYMERVAIVQLIISLVLIFALAYLGRLLNYDYLTILLGLNLLLWDRLFVGQMFTTMLDLPHGLTYILVAIYVVKLGRQPQRIDSYRWLLGLALGLVALTKLWIGAILITPVVLWSIYRHRSSLSQSLRDYICVLLAGALVYLIVYAPTIFGPNGIERLIMMEVSTVRLYAGYLSWYPWGEIGRIIMFGQWRIWWSDQLYQSVIQWWVVWPMATINAIYVVLLGRTAVTRSEKYVAWIVLIYLIGNWTHVVFPRYLLTVIPLMYLLLSGTWVRILVHLCSSFQSVTKSPKIQS